jgi:hypothetical protein
MTDFSRTRKALKKYDASKPARARRWETAATDQDVAAAVAQDKAAEDLVREAFAVDTKYINSKDRALLVRPDDPWLRGLVEKHTL